MRDPINFFDPSGEYFIISGLGIGALVLAAIGLYEFFCEDLEAQDSVDNYNKGLDEYISQMNGAGGPSLQHDLQADQQQMFSDTTDTLIQGMQAPGTISGGIPGN